MMIYRKSTKVRGCGTFRLLLQVWANEIFLLLLEQLLFLFIEFSFILLVLRSRRLGILGEILDELHVFLLTLLVSLETREHAASHLYNLFK
jgi:hypothetical protein